MKLSRRPLRHLPFSFLFLTALGSCAYAQQAANSALGADESQALANRYVHEILPYWQHRLQLDDWNVHILLSRPQDLRPGTLGNIHWNREQKAATIRVMDVSGYHTDLVAMLKDMQVTVVHELVHLELASLPVAEADRTNQEFAIDRLTDALLAADEGRALTELLPAANPPALSR
ncbi:MAG TPA: hypothetical protein VG672_09535 [Bryobacteraceae bacterium]|nr:hypothetical protein [Bryobacteraceae bacterium]HWB96934.1 hypothetical protein [Bryobacteraceae bacterium]